MPTKKKTVVKRSSTIKKTAGKTKTTGSTVRVTAAPASELFRTHEHPPTVEVKEGEILLFINGRKAGTFTVKNKSFHDFITEHASNAGIKTFSVYADDEKADTSFSGRQAAEFKKIEIVTKDTRG